MSFSKKQKIISSQKTYFLSQFLCLCHSEALAEESDYVKKDPSVVFNSFRMTAILLSILLLSSIFLSCHKDNKQDASIKDLPEITATASVDKASATINDTIKYTIELKYKKDLKPQIPEFGKNLAGFRVVDFGTGSPIEDKGAYKLTKWYNLVADLAGSYIIPAVEVKYGQDKSIKTPQIFVEIKTLLTDSSADIRDIKPQAKIPFNYTKLFIIIGLVILAAAIIFVSFIFIRRYLANKKKVIVIPPHEIAYKELNELVKKHYFENKRYKEYYFNLSEILRKYFEGRYSIPTIDRTTDEIFKDLKHLYDLSGDNKKLFENFLTHTDLVKFSKYIPSEPEAANALKDSYSFIDNTKKVEIERQGEHAKNA